MKKERPISELNLHFNALMNMVDEFKKGNTSEYFEGVEEDYIPFRKIELIRLKIDQILRLMIVYEYYDDIAYSNNIEWFRGILTYAITYIDELYNWQLDKEE